MCLLNQSDHSEYITHLSTNTVYYGIKFMYPSVFTLFSSDIFYPIDWIDYVHWNVLSTFPGRPWHVIGMFDYT